MKQSKEELLKLILELEQNINMIQYEIKSNPDNPFSLYWNNSKKTIMCQLSENDSKKHRQNKVKLANTFLKMVQSHKRTLELQLKKLIK